jgi:hypothetical protein
MTSKNKGTRRSTSCPFVDFVVKALTVACPRVSCRPTTSHDFLQAVQIAFAPALSSVAVPDALPAAVVAQLDAPLVPSAGPVDGPQAPAEAYKYCAQSAVAEPA